MSRQLTTEAALHKTVYVLKEIPIIGRKFSHINGCQLALKGPLAEYVLAERILTTRVEGQSDRIGIRSRALLCSASLSRLNQRFT